MQTGFTPLAPDLLEVKGRSVNGTIRFVGAMYHRAWGRDVWACEHSHYSKGEAKDCAKDRLDEVRQAIESVSAASGVAPERVMGALDKLK